jgi:hypothetical protein
MKPLHKGLLVALLHVLVVSSLGGKLLYDRATRPRVWVRAAPYDPNLPIRGRYVRLQVEMSNQMVAEPAADGALRLRPRPEGNEPFPHERIPVAFFIPEHVDDPSIRREGEELWAEVTIPRRGPPRPIRLGVKRRDTLTLLNLD